MTRRRGLLLAAGALALLLVWLSWEFRPLRFVESPPPLPAGYRVETAAWLGVTWAMDPHTTAEIEALAHDLQAHGVTYIFPYVSYLKPGNVFNPTFDHAASFVARFRAAAREVAILGWVGVPIQVSGVENRLLDPEVRRLIAEFGARLVTEFGYDGVHLNAEMIPDGDGAYIATLQALCEALPPGTTLSVAAHTLRPTERITLAPYPTGHWSDAYLRTVAEHSDQVVIMAYDSGLFLPSDYRAWMAYQVRASAAALAEVDASLLIGLPASEEWTPSHQTAVEYLENALYGVRVGLAQSDTPDVIDGFAVYPYWEMDGEEWRALDTLFQEDR